MLPAQAIFEVFRQVTVIWARPFFIVTVRGPSTIGGNTVGPATVGGFEGAGR